jgi:PAS domain S-box-containing protein
MTSDTAFDAREIRRARYTIFANMACCGGWVVLNAIAAWLLGNARLLGLSASALAMIACWVVALRDIRQNRVMRGVLNYVLSGLLLLLAMGLFVPEMAVLFVFATFIFLAYGLSYANTSWSALVVGLTMLVAGVLLFASPALHASSGVDPGLLRWVNVTGMTMALGINGVSFIALRKTLEERGQRLNDEARFRALLESAPDAMVIAGQGGRIAFVNHQAELLFGYPREELIAESIEVLLPERLREGYEADRAKFFGDPKARVMGTGLDLFARRKDGTEFPVEISLSPLETKDGILISSAIRDTTARKRTETELRRAKDVAERSSRELEAFSYSVAHDLQAPLRAVNGYSAALVEDLGPRLQGDEKQHLERIGEAATRMAELIDALLDLARVSRTELRREQVDLSKLAETVGARLRAGETSRTVDFVVQQNLVVRVDAALALALMENLLGNAWKFAAKKEGSRIEFGQSRDASGTFYFVRDNGAGFDMAYAGKLFTPFQRLHSPAEFPGTGIGLATVQRIVQRHGGLIWAEAAPGQGATFRFTLGEESEA